MANFNTYLNESVLTEALNSPVEFFMTDDSKIPTEIFASFTINGNDYGCSLVLSKYERVYNLDFYRIVNVKKRFWSFLSPKDILPALSTVIRFMEACFPFLYNRMDGILIDVPGKTSSERYTRLLKAVVKKSYVKKYKVTDVTKTSEKANNYLFLTKVGSDPKKLYKTAAFHKNFSFEPDLTAPISSEVLDTVAGEYYKKLKPNVSMKPSTKYAFGAVPANLEVSDDLVTSLDNAKDDHLKKIVTPEEDKPKVKEPTVDIVSNEDLAAEIGGGFSDHSSFVHNSANNHTIIGFPYLMAALMPNAYKKVTENGYNEKFIDMGNLKYVLNQSVTASLSNMPKAVKDSLYSMGFTTESGQFIDTDENLKKVLTAMQLFPFLNKTSIDAIVPKIVAEIPYTTKKTSGGKGVVSVEKLELPFVPESKLMGFEGANTSTPYDGHMGFQEEPEKHSQRMDSVRDMPSVKAWYDKGMSGTNFKSLYDYTNGSYDNMNSNLRNMAKNGEFKLSDSTPNSKSRRLMKYFEKEAPTLDDAIWVYRNVSVPNSIDKFQVGDDFVDAGFLSTSVRASCSIGWLGNIRWKIYLPKGTRCFPVFDYSAHSSENEIVLPAFSMIRITEIHRNVKAQGHACMVGIYIGNANSGALDLINKNSVKDTMTEDAKLFSYFTESKKMTDKKEILPKTDNPKDKWSQPSLSYDDMKIVKKMIADGTLKTSK